MLRIKDHILADAKLEQLNGSAPINETHPEENPKGFITKLVSFWDCETQGGSNCTLMEHQEELPSQHVNLEMFYFSCLLFIFTYSISVTLKKFKNAPYLCTKLRQTVSDFSVLIAIFLMTLIDFLVGLPTPKLYVPNEFKVSLRNRKMRKIDEK